MSESTNSLEVAASQVDTPFVVLEQDPNIKTSNLTSGQLSNGAFIDVRRITDQSNPALRTYAAAYIEPGANQARLLPRAFQIDFRTGGQVMFYTGNDPSVLNQIKDEEERYSTNGFDEFGYGIKQALDGSGMLVAVSDEPMADKAFPDLVKVR